MSIRIHLLAACVIMLSTQITLARTLIVDKSGLGSYTSIQAGVNAALAGDTVKVYPGVYNEQVNISTNIVVQGSGYEYTQIVSNSDPAVSMSSGKVMWFAISSNTGRGVAMSGGTLTNCVVWNCAKYGLDATGGTTAIIQNCVLVNSNSNGSQAHVSSSTTATFINCIIWANTASNTNAYSVIDISGTSNDLYCVVGTGGTYVGTGNISSNPQFASSTDFTLSGGSPCIDAGKPDIYDPDGTRSDMGYYGGPDAPVFPVVTNLRIYLNPDGSVNVQATAQSRY
ncbi:MAG TPA: hypothetical protein VLX91_10925 [Candidatus Acidoferrales bacterium]|nr:hypothetical protein [Candidatus Acidoferrales bacterium]